MEIHVIQKSLCIQKAVSNHFVFEFVSKSSMSFNFLIGIIGAPCIFSSFFYLHFISENILLITNDAVIYQQFNLDSIIFYTIKIIRQAQITRLNKNYLMDFYDNFSDSKCTLYFIFKSIIMPSIFIVIVKKRATE